MSHRTLAVSLLKPGLELFFLHGAVKEEALRQVAVYGFQEDRLIERLHAFCDTGYAESLRHGDDGPDQNLTLTHLRDSLLPKLMSGELDVSEIDL